MTLHLHVHNKLNSNQSSYRHIFIYRSDFICSIKKRKLALFCVIYLQTNLKKIIWSIS